MKAMTDKEFEEVKTALETVWHLIQVGKPEQLPEHQTEIIQAVNTLALIETPDTAVGDESDGKITYNSYARRELEALEKACKSDKAREMQRFVTQNVLDLMRVFSKQGHSGFSASYVMNLFRRVSEYKPLTPLTGADDEWNEPMDMGGDKTQQNKRCCSVFRTNFDNSTARDIDAMVFSDNGGVTWFTSPMKSKNYDWTVKFPYMPPDEPRRIYIKYTKEVPPGETCDEFVDITDDREEQKRLREKFRAGCRRE